MIQKRSKRLSVLLLPLLLMLVVFSNASADTAGIVSVNSMGVQGNGNSYYSSISADGRFVTFHSTATNLVSGDANNSLDVFIKDRQTGVIKLASISSDGIHGDGESSHPVISADGRYVAFMSASDNLVAGDSNGKFDIFVHDLQAGTTEIVSINSNGVQGNGNSFYPSISADGRFVAFVSVANNLIPSDTNGTYDIFVHDRQTGTTELGSVNSNGVQANGSGYNYYPFISADGRFVAFQSYADNLVPNDTNGAADIFVRDRLLGITERVSVDSYGVQGNNMSTELPSISSDGRFVAFMSTASNLVPNDGNGKWDIFRHDRLLGITELVSVDSNGIQADGFSSYPSMSADGKYIVFVSTASNLAQGDTNGVEDVFIRDLQTGTTKIVSANDTAVIGNGWSYQPFISPDGRYIVFTSAASNLVPGDANGSWDVFINALDFVACPSGYSLSGSICIANPLTYTITTSAGTGGSISPASAVVNDGESKTFTIIPNTGYHIASVSGCGGTLSNNTYTTGQITADCTVTASFAVNTYTVTPVVIGNGNITPDTPQGITYGGTISFTLTPASNHHLVSVSGCGGTLTGATYTTGPVTADCTVEATFAPDANQTIIKAGHSYTAVLKADGALWVWGANNYGQLGDGTTINRYSPIQVGVGTTWTGIAAGYYHTVALRDDGTLWAWGRNTDGQLGDGTTTNKYSPVQVGTDTDWVSVAAGSNHTLALKSNGTLWIWGDNSYGQLGIGVGSDRLTPVQVGAGTEWATISAGSFHTIALKSDSTLWTWGFNSSGQLGDGTGNGRYYPTQVGSASDWAAAEGGKFHTVALKTDGSLWTWGDNLSGQIGNGALGPDRYTPFNVGIGTTWTTAAAGHYYTLAIRSDATLWGWGDSSSWQLGDGSGIEQPSPIQIGVDADWVSAAGGALHTIALKSDGTLWAWGTNTSGQLGDGTTTSRPTPVPVIVP